MVRIHFLGLCELQISRDCAGLLFLCGVGPVGPVLGACGEASLRWL